jgi:translation initiation factor 2-alpha kinase 4
MAPLRTPKNKKQTHDASMPMRDDGMGPTSPFGDSRPPLLSQTSETYEKAQEDEREVLKAVFMDDFVESEAKGAWSVSADISLLLRTLDYENARFG